MREIPRPQLLVTKKEKKSIKSSFSSKRNCISNSGWTIGDDSRRLWSRAYFGNFYAMMVA